MCVCIKIQFNRIGFLSTTTMMRAALKNVQYPEYWFYASYDGFTHQYECASANVLTVLTDVL